jgi:small ubiquitin-related modifier
VPQVKRSLKLEKLFSCYAARKGIDLYTVRFFHHGHKLESTDTPESTDLVDQDTIDVVHVQCGD